MGVKRNMAFLLSGTALGIGVLAAAPAFAQEAPSKQQPSKQQLQREINSLQQQLEQMKSQQISGLYD